MISTFVSLQKLLNHARYFDFVASLSLRIYLAPIFIAAGWHKLHAFNSTAEWFGNNDWGLGLPFPIFMTGAAIFAEFVGGFALLLGFATRWFSAMLLATMLVAIFFVHLPNGWFAITPTNPNTSTAAILAKVGMPGAQSSIDNSVEAGLRLEKARDLLKEHGNYTWLTEKGSFVILNNGIEFAVTYFIMLFTLLCSGAGRFFSLDYWIARRYLTK